MTIKTESVSLEDARRVVAAGEAKADEIGSPSNIAVVDVGGNLVAHIRMDEAWIGSVDISVSKAFTSRAFDISTADLAANAGPGEQFFGIDASNNGRVMIFAGGVPLRLGDRIVGAVGVSGGSGEQDQTVAEAAATAL
ncbi:GlcG/HbpS family heme-binding protein [Streptomyces maremycinicus]|uniref:GlcG/HbpS family heme-binding protein n=1 Tax=Streptomyces maremycinicus TaxID=1679753 RepID=UPI000787A41C|nr:heme-binding protein [Streptomyces sp. NBRC 110468]